ncbi:anti-sigma factor [Aureimonas fodinaquatilis]|uniref:Anti-sigma factor n=1 Tax=Aureimonas fodinaquatilis TaxID=2565783 RepID=A0A5B0DTF8_9HYPH|nr:anti-sigma factor [Aureimonas fodinaquatilis]KAA0969051.1 anti-sigma factor [Aureimonas fodinaquatilis]
MTQEQMERAGLYVIGVMSGTERALFEAEMERDGALARRVRALEATLQRLDDTATPLPRSDELWARIERQLKEAEKVSVLPVSNPKSRRQQSMQRFRMAASLLLALGVGYLAGTFTRPVEQPIMIAVLINETDASPGAIVEAFADDSIRLVPLEAFDVPAGHILEVWTLPDADTGPVSLGTFSDPATIRLDGPSLPLPEQGQLYEITLEPAPGSPTGRPTGPILVKGFARAPI